MVVLVPFLLITAVFSRMARSSSSICRAPRAGAVSEIGFRPEVIVREIGIEITNGRQMIAAIPKVDGEYDIATLANYMISLKREYPDVDAASVLLEPQIPYDYLVRVMDVVRRVDVPGRNRRERLRARRVVPGHSRRRSAVRNSRRMTRLSRFRPKVSRLNLTSLMDVFTILVFFLVMNSGPTEILDAPNDLVLPESVVEAKPSETVVIYVGKEEVLVQGQPVARIADIIAAGGGGDIVPIMARLAELQDRVIGLRTQAVAQSSAVTILADKSIPFSVVKQVMSTCTAQGYTRISLAVIQKESAVAAAGTTI